VPPAGEGLSHRGTHGGDVAGPHRMFEHEEYRWRR
jgi:hypothetical protein